MVHKLLSYMPTALPVRLLQVCCRQPHGHIYMEGWEAGGVTLEALTSVTAQTWALGLLEQSLYHPDNPARCPGVRLKEIKAPPATSLPPGLHFGTRENSASIWRFRKREGWISQESPGFGLVGWLFILFYFFFNSDLNAQCTSSAWLWRKPLTPSALPEETPGPHTALHRLPPAPLQATLTSGGEGEVGWPCHSPEGQGSRT